MLIPSYPLSPANTASLLLKYRTSHSIPPPLHLPTHTLVLVRAGHAGGLSLTQGVYWGITDQWRSMVHYHLLIGIHIVNIHVVNTATLTTVLINVTHG